MIDEMIGNCFSSSGGQFSKNKEDSKFFYFISPTEHQRTPKEREMGKNGVKLYLPVLCDSTQTGGHYKKMGNVQHITRFFTRN
ncbi:MAG: hypothetical protein NUV76_01530 [Candidatus Kuenenia sp.]|nr:hypothetical protein [Candidatus Kuenenia sp.]